MPGLSVTAGFAVTLPGDLVEHPLGPLPVRDAETCAEPVPIVT